MVWVLAMVCAVFWASPSASGQTSSWSWDFESDPIADGWTYQPGTSGLLWTEDEALSGTHSIIANYGLWISPAMNNESRGIYRCTFNTKGWPGQIEDRSGGSRVYHFDNSSKWVEHTIVTRYPRVWLSSQYALFFADDVEIAAIDSTQANQILTDMLSGISGFDFSTDLSANRHDRIFRTMAKLALSGPLKIVLLGDSIINDTSNSFLDLHLERMYPQTDVTLVRSIRGSTGCWWYKEENRVQSYVLDHEPDLVLIGGISQFDDIDSIRTVTEQIRQGDASIEIALMSEVVGNHDPSLHPEDLLPIDPLGTDYRNRLWQLAAEQNVGFIDMTRPWARFIDSSQMDYAKFMRDAVHANYLGTVIIGETLKNYFAPTGQPVGILAGWGQGPSGQITDIPSGINFATVDAGKDHCVALKGDGSIVSWGYSLPGQPTGTGFRKVSAGGYHSLAIRSDGSIAAWGSVDLNGLLSGAPTEGEFAAVAAGLWDNIALNTDGSIVAWGTDYDGRISNAPAGTGYRAIAAGSGTSPHLAIDCNGSIVAWGGLDDANMISGVPTGGGFIDVASGGSFCLALKNDGSVVAWGNDQYGQVSNTPSGTGFVQIAAGANHAVALRSDGSVVSWGRNDAGQVSTSPSGNDYAFVSASGSLSMAVRIPQYALTVTSGNGSGSYTAGELIAITADPAATQMVFDAWTGDANGILDQNAATTTLTMPPAIASITATYRQAGLVSLTVLSGSGSGVYFEGQIVPIAADESPTYIMFDLWIGDTAALGNTETAETTFTVGSSDSSVTATYTPAPQYWPGDINQDLFVDITDLNIVLINWSGDPDDITALNKVLIDWGKIGYMTP